MSSAKRARMKNANARSSAQSPTWNASRIRRLQSDANAGDFLRAWQPDERDREQQIHASVARDRRWHAETESDRSDFRALVLAGNAGDRDGPPTNDSRLRRLSSSALRRPISRSRRSRSRDAR